MSEYTVFDSTGRIRWTCDQNEPPDLDTGWNYEEGRFSENFYHNGSTAVPKTTGSASADKSFVLANGLEVVTISGITPPARCTIYGPAVDSFEVTESTLELTFDASGVYRVVLDQVPHNEQEFTINAT